MNQAFQQLSLEAGGAHYPTINPDLQQRFGELIVKKILLRIEHEIGLAYDYEESYAIAVLQAMALEILDDFDMELGGDDEQV